jgi:hypothetical protein
VVAVAAWGKIFPKPKTLPEVIFQLVLVGVVAAILHPSPVVKHVVEFAAVLNTPIQIEVAEGYMGRVRAHLGGTGTAGVGFTNSFLHS